MSDADVARMVEDLLGGQVTETTKVILLVLGAGGLACVFIGAASMLGRFLRANAEVQTQPTPEQRDDYSWPVLRDVANPEHYPKTWAYREARGAEETAPIQLEPEPLLAPFVPGVEDHEYTEPIKTVEPELGSTYVSRSRVNGTDLLS